MARRIVLHIGAEKTGSTTIQSYLQRNRELLERRSVLYSRAAGEVVHFTLPAFACNDNKRDDLRLRLGITEDQASLDAFRAKLVDDLMREADESDAETFVYSTEHGQSRIRDAKEIARLAELLHRIADDIQIILYLRRQDRVATSLYSTRVRSGQTSKDIFPPLKPHRLAYYDFHKIYTRWCEAFGAQQVTVRLFERPLFKNGDLIDDFLDAAQLPNLPEAEAAGVENASLSANAVAVMWRLLAQLPQERSAASLEARAGLSQFVERCLPGPPIMPARDDAKWFYGLFAEGNAALREKLPNLVQRPTLFDEDFSRYPETQTEVALDPDDLAKVALAFRGEIVETRRVNRALHERLANLEGRLAAATEGDMTGEVAAARAAAEARRASELAAAEARRVGELDAAAKAREAERRALTDDAARAVEAASAAARAETRAEYEATLATLRAELASAKALASSASQAAANGGTEAIRRAASDETRKSKPQAIDALRRVFRRPN